MVGEIYELKNKILAQVKKEITERGVEKMDVEEVGKMVDMVKDLADAEKNCWKADYYRAVTEAMGSQGYSQGYTPMGYAADNRGPVPMGYAYGYQGRDANGRYNGRRGYMGYPEPDMRMDM